MNKLDKNNTREALKEFAIELANLIAQWYDHDLNNEQIRCKKEILIRETIEKIHAEDKP